MRRCLSNTDTSSFPCVELGLMVTQLYNENVKLRFDLENTESRVEALKRDRDELRERLNQMSLAEFHKIQEREKDE